MPTHPTLCPVSVCLSCLCVSGGASSIRPVIWFGAPSAGYAAVGAFTRFRGETSKINFGDSHLGLLPISPSNLAEP